MTIQPKQFTSSYPNRVKNNKRHLTILPLVFMLGLFLPVTFGVLTASAEETSTLEASNDNPDVSAINDINGILVSSLPTGTDNIDTPLTEYVAFTGRVDIAVGGKSFFEDTVADNFDVDVPACSNGSKPIIHGAYVEWYMRWRGEQSVVDAGNNIPNFDPDLNIDINGNGSNNFTITDQYWGRFDSVNPAADSRAFYRRNALIDVTTQFDADWTAGVNNIAISGVVLPLPDESDPDVNNSEIYGVGIHVFHECLEFDYGKVAFHTGLDWFYEVQDQPYAGNYSDLVCVTFPTVPAATQVDIAAIMSGQANAASPFRGGRLFYLTGTGTPPTVNSADGSGPAGTIVNSGTQIRTGYESIWNSSLGTEWDEVVEPDAITLNTGDEWACIQAESVREPGSTQAGISGDILGTAFLIPLPPPADWGDLPDGIYNTDSTGTPGPSHPIIPTLGIGPIVDDELDGQPNATATGDDANGDDEDGIELPPVPKIGDTAVFTGSVTNNTGQDAFFYAFVDWNGDGSFDGPNEVISTTIPTGSTDLEVPMTFTVPAGAAVDTDLGVRFRLSTADDLGPDGPAPDGEVEDYLYRLMPGNYDLALIKRVASTGPYQVGDQVTFNILVMNQGGVDSGEYTVADTLPPELTFVSANPAATIDPGFGSTGVITWTGTNLIPGEIVTFTVTAEIDSLPTGPIKNIAEITSDSGEDDDSDPTDNSDEDDTFNDDDVTNDKDDNDEDDSDFEEIVVGEYDLALIKRLVSTGPFDVGDQVTFSIVVMNQGTVNSGDFTVEDTLPAELTFVSADPVATTAPVVGTSGVVSWDSTDLAAGDMVTFTITAELAAFSTAPIKNIAEITADSGNDDDSDPADNSDEDDTFNDDDVTNDKDDNDEDDSDFEFVPIAEYDLALIKRIVSTGPFAVGDQITFNVVVMNQGQTNSGDFTVEDTLPAELTFVSANPAATTAPAVGTSGIVSWDSTNLAAGDMVTFTITAELASIPATPIKNIAEITADSGNDDDSDPADNSDEDDTFNDDDVTNDQDPNDEDDSDFEFVPIAEYDLALIKRLVSPGPFAVGDQITFNVMVMNQGQTNSGDFTVEDTLPAELTFVSANPAATTAPAVGTSGTVSWDSTNLAAGDMVTFTITAELASLPTAPIKNIAEITADSGEDDDSDPTDNSDEDDTFNDDDVTNDQDPNDEDDSDFEFVPVAEYDLALVKKIVSAGPYQLGQEITYQIEVMNQGDINSGDYTVEDNLPAELVFVSASPAATSSPAVGSSGTITWDATNLAPGDIAVFTLVARIDAAPAPGSPIKNTAEITADSGEDDDSDPTDDSDNSDTFDDDDVTNDQDPNDEDDSDFEEIVLGEYDLALIKEIVSTGPYTIGQEITYQITVMNQGELDSGEYKVADKLPAELTLVSVNPAATSAPPLGQSGEIIWTGTNLAPGEMAIFTIVATIVSESQAIKNVADIIEDSGDDNDSDPTDDSGDSDTINDDDVTNDQDPNDEDDSDFEIIQVPAPVPPSAVELVSFTGMRTGNRQATLLWQTASEIDHFGFKVLRSNNGRITDSQSVGWIPSTIDNGPAPGNNYSLVDDVPAPGTYTYWLVDIDTSGVETIHGPVTVTVSRGWQVFLPIVSKP